MELGEIKDKVDRKRMELHRALQKDGERLTSDAIVTISRELDQLVSQYQKYLMSRE